ncbi:MAG TPA: GNAT family N-acetyltransferase [Roseateles sp.]|nr:GNAT family N-acetyltransferase [Roseateles sp.]
MNPLTTARLSLEPLLEGHAAEMFAVLADPAIYAYENAPPASVEALAARYRRLQARRSPDGREQWLNWVARLSASGAAIGYVQATIFADGHAAIAYELDSRYWGRGLAQEAVRAMLAALADTYRVSRITATLKCRNERSLRLLQRLGFEAAEAAEGLEPDERQMTLSRPPV